MGVGNGLVCAVSCEFFKFLTVITTRRRELKDVDEVVDMKVIVKHADESAPRSCS